MEKILFICTGNTCRSPMAQAIFNHLAGDSAVAKSAGLLVIGTQAEENARLAVLERGIDLTGHVPTQVSPQLMGWADKVYCMTAGHKRALGLAFPQLADKVFTLSADISDPFGGSLERYEICAGQIAACVADILAPVDIVPMEHGHLDQVLEIENQNFSHPWSRGMFLSELENPSSVYFVAQKAGQVLGYAGLMNIAGEGHVVNVAVKKEQMRAGLGTRLVARLEQLARERGCHMLTLEVRQSNVAARRLYEKFGLAGCGVRKNYYQDPDEDGIIMSKNLD